MVRQDNEELERSPNHGAQGVPMVPAETCAGDVCNQQIIPWKSGSLSGRYGLALLVVVVATLCRWWMGDLLGHSSQFLTYYPAIMVAAVFGGTGPGLLATLLGAVAGNLLFFGHSEYFHLGDTDEIARLLLLLGTGVFISIMTGRLRVAREVAKAEARAARTAERALRQREQQSRLKLDSILSPEGDLATLELAEIIDVAALQSLMDDFHHFARIPLAIVDLKGRVLVGVGWQDICTKFHRAHPETCAHCVESDLYLSAGVPAGECRLYKCKNNMWDIATPIVVGGRHVGNIFSGQFFFEDERVDHELFRGQARRYGYAERAYLAAVEKVPRLSRVTVDTGMAFLMKLADMISRLSYSNLNLARLVAERDALTHSLRESEGRLNRAQEIAHLGSWVLDVVEDHLTWSDEVYRIFGLKPQEFAATYEAFLDVVHPEDRDAVDGAYAASLREVRDAYEVEHRVIRKDNGEIRFVHEKCQHLRDASGRVIRSIGMVHDITERERAEEELRQQREWLHVTLNSIGDAVMTCDAGGFVTFLNPVAEALTGWKNDEAAGQSIQRVFHIINEQTHQPAEDIIGRVLREGHAVELANHTALVHREGREIPIEDSAAPIADAAGHVAGVVLVFHDVTQKRRAHEALYSVALFPEQNPNPVMRIAPGGVLLYTNQIGRQFLTSLDWRQGQPLPEPILNVAAEVLNAQTAREVEFVDHDGRTFSFIVTPVPGEDYVNLYGLDITGRKRAERALHLHNERMTLLSEAAVHLLKSENPDTMVLELFDKVSRHLDLHAYFNFTVNETGDALRLDSYAGIPPEAARSIERLDFGVAVCGTVAQTRRPIYATHIQQSDDPKVQLIKGYGIRAYACNPLMAGERLLGTLSFASRGRDGFDEDELEFMRTICQYVAMAKERLRLEKELRLHIQQLADADQRKDEFLAMLAHELRNPLAPVRNAVQILRMVGTHEPVPARQHDIIERQVTHMARLLDDLLDVSRITRGKIKLKKKSIALADVLAHAVETAAPMIEGRHQRLSVTIPPEEIRVEADPDRLAQVVGNLLTNAAKYTDAGGRIWLEGMHAGAEVIIRVRDDGVGIAPEMLPRIFDLFAQADLSLDRSQGGLGIGLTMVQSLVEMHGGCVEANSAGLGQGSEFTIHLPALPGIPAVRPGAKGPAMDACAATAVRRRILVVDDVTDSAETLAELLSLWGYDVRTADSGPHALEAARQFNPEVVLLDIGLPGMNGYEVARRLRQKEDGRRILLLAMSGYTQETDRRLSQEAGFDHHLAKPVNLEQLRTLLQ